MCILYTASNVPYAYTNQPAPRHRFLCYQYHDNDNCHSWYHHHHHGREAVAMRNPKSHSRSALPASDGEALVGASTGLRMGPREGGTSSRSLTTLSRPQGPLVWKTPGHPNTRLVARFSCARQNDELVHRARKTAHSDWA